VFSFRRNKFCQSAYFLSPIGQKGHILIFPQAPCDDWPGAPGTIKLRPAVIRSQKPCLVLSVFTLPATRLGHATIEQGEVAPPPSTDPDGGVPDEETPSSRPWEFRPAWHPG
jgi:hypothetical protein